jgi:hypothetical protein
MDVSWDFPEESPMTMQIAIQASNGLVLASDRKTRRTGMKRSDPSEVSYEDKVCLCENHKIVIALSGVTFGFEEAEPAPALKRHLDSIIHIPDTRKTLKEWGDGYFKETFSTSIEEAKSAVRLLIANAELKHDPFHVLDVASNSNVSSTKGMYVVTGDSRNSAIFWPAFFHCDASRHDLTAVTNIAAATILMGHKFNNDGVGGLDLWQFQDEWEQLGPEKIEGLKLHVDHLEYFMQSLLRWV